MRATLIVTLAALCSIPAIATAQDHSGRKFVVTLEGEVEVPRKGDLDGTGTAVVRVNPGQGQLCYTLTVSGIAPATAAHIHEAPAGAAGPVVAPLAAPSDGSSEGCTAIDREEAMDIIRNPGNYYVNVHNAEFPGGALRGQLSR